MPYIANDLGWREILDGGAAPQSVGHLTYALTVPIRRYMQYIRHATHEDPRFEHYADVLAALDSCANEFREGPLREYEDKKKAENGDIDWGI